MLGVNLFVEVLFIGLNVCYIIYKGDEGMKLFEEINVLFEKVPTDFDRIKKLFAQRKFTKEELSKIALKCVDNCFGEYHDACNPEYTDFTVDNMNSTYILDSISLLLELGLDPNIIVNDESLIWNTMWIDAPNIGASVMRLLLENEGDPNCFLPSEGETVFDYISFKVSYDEYPHEYFHTVQCWLVLMAYGACWKNGEIPLTMLNGNSVEIFKNFELYDYTIETLPSELGKYSCWIMHIYNVETNEEVARYK